MTQDKSEHIQELFDRWCNGTASPSDVHTLLELAGDVPFEEAFAPLLQSGWEATAASDAYSPEQRQALAAAIVKAHPASPGGRVVKLRTRVLAAAAVLLLIVAGAGAVLWWPGVKKQRPPVSAAIILPGNSKATLTLADGSSVTLDSTHRQLIRQGGTAIRQAGGQLQYNAGAGDGAVSINTLSTPRGGQFRVQLPDGTEVWLNAASTLRYPTAFKGKERRVTLTGEAYFEVAKNAAMPFIVAANGKAEMEVLGTGFDVNAYADEQTLKTTLFEGSLRVVEVGNGPQGKDQLLLHPGQQAQVSSGISLNNQPDLDQVAAWKNGLFNFEDADLPEVMRQIGRWYDIEVVYETAHVPRFKFFGELSRDLTLNELIIALKDAEVHFRIEGRKLIVMP